MKKRSEYFDSIDGEVVEIRQYPQKQDVGTKT